MAFNKRFFPALIGAAAILSGCGTTGLASSAIGTSQAPSTSETPDVVNLPGNYVPGITYPSMAGAPSLTKPEFPALTKTSTGVAGDPVNVVVAATRTELRDALRAQGWVDADPITLGSTLKMITKGIAGGAYPTAPMSDLYLYGRKQDMALEANQEGVRARDHLRVWQTPLQDSNGRSFWAIAATRDVAIKLGPGMTLPTHQIAPDVDTERLLVVTDILKSGKVALRYAFQTLPTHYQGLNGGGDEWYSDGQTIVLEFGT